MRSSTFENGASPRTLIGTSDWLPHPMAVMRKARAAVPGVLPRTRRADLLCAWASVRPRELTKQDGTPDGGVAKVVVRPGRARKIRGAARPVVAGTHPGGGPRSRALG